MNQSQNNKVTARHLRRNAYLYIRQSTLRQVFENTESTRRQYALRQRALALGWSEEQLIIIDSDLGQSGASAVDREGFQRLVTEVGMGRAGIVLGLEVSRLARNSSDWHRLLEICALTGTLILDEDGIYDPCHFNDRLLLGMKGAMSEAELHVLQSRLQGGLLNKARRGQLALILPIGFSYDAAQRVTLDPDTQVQDSIRLFFDTFRRTGSAWATVKAFRADGLLFPHRIHRGPHKGELEWLPLETAQALNILHNPRYAGAFVFGRTRMRKKADGGVFYERLPKEEWQVILRDTHVGYITWEQYQENERRLREGAQSYGHERRRSPVREGAALLQGIVICGLCGRRMTVRYRTRSGRSFPDYRCQRESIDACAPECQSIPGARIDEVIGELLLTTMTPVALEVALAVQAELRAQAEQADQLRRQAVERARYEAELAQRRYLQVDPANRLVAGALETEWNTKLRVLEEVRQEYERRQQTDQLLLDERQRGRVVALATDFPRLWRDPRTPARERKRLVRLLLEDVTLTRGEKIKVQVRFKGGRCETLELPLPPTIEQVRKTDPAVIAEIDHLLDRHIDSEIAALLNEREMVSGAKLSFTAETVRRLRRSYGLRSRYQRLRAGGLLTKQEIAQRLGITPGTVEKWQHGGRLRAVPYNEKNECLYENPGPVAPRKYQKRRYWQAVPEEHTSDTTYEVQYEA